MWPPGCGADGGSLIADRFRQQQSGFPSLLLFAINLLVPVYLDAKASFDWTPDSSHVPSVPRDQKNNKRREEMSPFNAEPVLFAKYYYKEIVLK